MAWSGGDEDAYFRTLFDNSPDGIYLLDADGEIRDVNPRACQNLGYDKEELVGKNVMDFGTVPVEHPLQSQSDTTDGDEIVTVEGTHTRNDGSTYPVRVRMVEVDVEDDPRHLAICHDISSQRARQKELERKNEQLEQFASILSHDLRNPLNVAQGHLDLVLPKVENEHLETVATALDRMETLLESILQLAREGKVIGELEPVSLDTVLSSSAESLQDADAKIEGKLSGTILADRSRVIEVMENLLINAVEHGGSDVRIEVGNLPDGFYLSDNGPGFRTEDPDELLKAGSTAGENGTGIGLYVVRLIVEAHGWQIELGDSERGGARIEIKDVKFVAED